MTCTSCNNPLDADSAYCDVCGVKVEPVDEETLKKPSFAAVYHPLNHQELALIKMVLERESILYYVENEHGRQWTGPFLNMLGAGSATVHVQEDRLEDAVEFLREELGLKI